jgi:hypothetical protein
LREHWKTVEIIATRLQKEETLDGTEIAALIRQQP